MVKKYTDISIPTEFKDPDQVDLRIGKDSSTACSAIKKFVTNSMVFELKMGDGVMSPIAQRVEWGLKVSKGSAGP